MARLYRLGSSGELIEASEKPFSYETTDMEEFVKKNSKILGDLIVFGEQVISSGRDKRTDLLALSKDGDVVIIELKKDLATKDYLGQVLGYRNFWKRSLEAVKNLWNDFKEKPEGIEPDFSNFDPKILLVAPDFDPELVEIVSLESLPIEFAEISRYEHKDSTFVLVDRIEAPETRIGPVRGQIEYGWDWYASEVARSDLEIQLAKSLYDQLTKLKEKNDWKVTPKFNKWYIAFKYGYRNVFTLEFKHARKVAICCQTLNDQSNPPRSDSSKWEWDANWEFWYTEVDRSDFDLSGVESVLDESYQRALAG